MARLLRLALMLAMGAIIQVSAEASAQSCPRSLASVLETPSCSGLRLQLATTLRTTIAPTGDANANDCVDTLRGLFTSPTSLPCTTMLTLLSTERHLRWYNYYQFYGPSSGKLRCKFDSVAPLSVANLNQQLVVECSEIDRLYDYTWLYQLLGLLVGVFWVYWRYERRPQAVYETELAEARRNNPRPAPMLDDRQRQALIEAGAAPRVNASWSARTECR